MICLDCGADTGGSAKRHPTPQACTVAWRAIAGYAMSAVMAAKKKILRCRIQGHRRQPRQFQLTLMGRSEVLEICDLCLVDGYVAYHVAAAVFEVLEKRGTQWETSTTPPSDSTEPSSIGPSKTTGGTNDDGSSGKSLQPSGS